MIGFFIPGLMGSAIVYVKQMIADGYTLVKEECPDCNGKGMVPITFMGPGQFLAYIFSGAQTEPCFCCSGKGAVHRWKKSLE